MTPHDVLKTVFGYHAFRPGQEKIIQAVLAGRDCLGVMPTGAGKSLTFQIPARLLKGTVLVISPLISLMKDQVDALQALGFKATLINSSVDFAERRQRLADFRTGKLELVYLAPEALEGSLRDWLQACPVSMVVVDEAHCISHWGHDFRPAYRKLQGLKNLLGEVPVLALTATATPQVAEDIVQQLGMVRPERYLGSFFRPNLVLTFQKKGEGPTTREAVLGFVRRHPGVSGIVYCWSRRNVESLVAFLKKHGISALPYHAGLSDKARQENQEAFIRDQVDVMVATIAFGMGIDKSNIRYVIHSDMPRSVESYYQEIGRAGRDGLPSQCLLFYSWADVMNYQRFLDGIQDPELAEDANAKTVALFRLADSRRCRHQAVVAYFRETIQPCADACDVCRGQSLSDLFRRQPLHAAPARARQSGVSPGSAGVALPGQAQLFEKLRLLRRRLADAQNVPAYVIFSDATLQEMAARQPQDERAFLEITGVGEVKLKRYGREFLKALERA